MNHVVSAVLGNLVRGGFKHLCNGAGSWAAGTFHVLELPEGLRVLSSAYGSRLRRSLYVVEFVADKVPYFDTVWDSIHTVIRPVAGALLAYGVVSSVDPQWEVIAALVGGGLALTSHTAKATTRAAANLSPEPFSNWI